MFKKFLSWSISIILMVSLLSGCGEKGVSTETAREKKTFSFFYVTGNTGAFDEEWEVFKVAEEKTNVHLTSYLAKHNTEAKTAYNLMMASGDVADIVGATKVDIDNYINQGVYIPLNDLIDQYAPNIKEFLKENDQIRKGITYPDGKIYFIPFVPDGDIQGAWFIRKDWLKKLGMEEPKDLDEFYNVLVAFKNNDPNGNGEKDEVPIFQRGKNLTPYFPLFGLRDGWNLNEATDTITFDKYSEAYKTAVLNLRKWYSEGLIDKEIYTRTQESRTYMLTENIGGITEDWVTSTSSFNKILKDKIPDFDFSIMPPPKDINGRVWVSDGRSKNPSSGWAISIKNPDPETTMKYFDFWFSEEGRRLANFGIEGKTYEMVDGKPMFTDFVLNNPSGSTVVGTLWKMGAQLPSGMGYQADYWYEAQTLPEDIRLAAAEYVENGWIARQLPSLTFTDEEREIISSKRKNIETFVSETEQQWIMGAKDIESTFEDYMNTLRKMGIEDVLKVYNDAYNRYKSN